MPRSWPNHRHEDADRRRLAGAVRADKAHDLSGLEAQAHVGQPEEPVGLVDAVEFNHGLVHGSLSSVFGRSSPLLFFTASRSLAAMASAVIPSR